MKGIIRFSAILVLCASFGCTPETDTRMAQGSPGVVFGTGTNDFLSLSADDVILRVDGRSLDKRTLEREVDLQVALIRLFNPELTDQVAEKMKHRMFPSQQRQLMSKMLLLNAAENEGLQPDAADIELVKQDILCAYGRNSLMGFKAVEKRLSKDAGAALETKIKEDALVFAYFRKRAPEAFAFTDEEYLAVSNHVNDLNRKSDELMQQQRKLAQEVYGKLKKGADFATVAKEHSVTTKEDMDGYLWGEYAPSEIPYPEVKAAVAGLKPGQFTAPLELEDGIHIIKLLKRTGAGVESAVTINPEEVTLGRIVLNRPSTYSLGSRTAVARSNRDEKLEPLQQAWLKDLKAKARIEYPSGTNLWSYLKKQQKKGSR